MILPLRCSCSNGDFEIYFDPEHQGTLRCKNKKCGLITSPGVAFAGLCGCDGSEDTEDWLRLLLESVEENRALEFLGDSSAKSWFILHQLAHHQLTEHGSNVGYGWLTCLGMSVLLHLREIARLRGDL